MFENPFKKKRMRKETVVSVAASEADPTTFSSLPPRKLEQIGTADHYGGNKLMTDGHENWYEIRKAPETQQVIARILKGIVNVSDIVKDKSTGKFYSQKMPTERIKEASSSAEIAADMALLTLVFGDDDRWVRTAKDINNAANSPHLLSESPEDARLHNIRHENDRAAYFDFDVAKDTFFFDGSLADSRFAKVFDYQTDESRKILNQKLSTLKKRLEVPEGKIFLEKIVESSGKQVFDDNQSGPPDELFSRKRSMLGIRSEDSLEFFRETLINRIEEALELNGTSNTSEVVEAPKAEKVDNLLGRGDESEKLAEVRNRLGLQSKK